MEKTRRISRAFYFLLTFSILFPSVLVSQSLELDAKEKGENWIERWREFETQRLRADGTPADPSIFLTEAVHVAQQKKLMPESRSMANTWVPIGPDVNAPGLAQIRLGRVNTIAFHPTDSNIFWIGVAQGGVWKTADHGQNWVPLTDDLPILRISDIAVDNTDPDIIYISVGDYAYLGAGLDLDDRKRHTHYGLGVYKTTDGGTNWQATGLTFDQTQRNESLIRRVLIDPNDHNHLVAAGIKGIFNSMDGGANWTIVNDSLIWDLIPDPNSETTLYAATGYVLTLDQGTAGILKSTDFGNTWTTLNTGIPGKGAVQRIKMAISPQDSNYVYAVACNLTRGFYGLYRSTNAGSSWTLQSTSPNVLTWSTSGGGSSGQGTYDLSLLVDPYDKDKIYVGGINMWGSTDGGVTWDGAAYWTGQYGASLHADQHFYAFNDLDDTYYFCHDGGVSRTKQVNIDGWSYVQSGNNWTTNWENLENMQITSYYRMGISTFNPGYYIAGAQDNSTTFRTPQGWANLIGGDGMDCLIHPVDPDIIYGSAQYGYLVRSTNGGQNFDYISGDMDNSGEQGAWTTPIIMDEQNLSTLYSGFGNVWKTTDSGDNWSKISNFPMVPGLGYPSPISDVDISGSSIYAAQRLYFSEGELSKMWVSTDQGSSWTNITAGLPDSLFFIDLDAVGAQGQIAYVSMSGFEAGKKVYKTTDAGASWQNFSKDLPNVPVNSIKYLEGSQFGTVFAGTDIGVFLTDNTMSGWQLVGTGLPNVIVSDLEIDLVQEKLFAATFGRGLWELDIQSIITGSSNLLVDGRSVSANVFPNPSKGILNIKSEGFSDGDINIRVVDVMGRSRLDLQMNYNEVMSLKTELGFGKYYLILNQGNHRAITTFMVD